MRRYALPLVIAGTAGLLVGLVVLWKSIGNESAPAPVTTPSRAPAAASAPAQTSAPAPTGPATARAPLPPAIPSRSAEPALPAESGTAGTSASQDSPPDTTSEAKNLELGLRQMRAQAAAVEPKVRECLAKAVASGDKATGDATLTFIAAKQGDKVVIEDTSYDAEQTSLKSDALIECLRQTSKAMTFKGLPHDVPAVQVTRTIKVANGELVENLVPKFSYIH